MDLPAIRGLMRDGVVFRNAFCASPLCAPARAALATGRRCAYVLVDALRFEMARELAGSFAGDEYGSELTIAVDGVLSRLTMFELCEAFFALKPEGQPDGPGTRLKLRTEVMAGTWEALLSGQADLAIGSFGELAHAVGQRRGHLAELARRGGEAARARDRVHHRQRFGREGVTAVVLPRNSM